jgi:hypothetical protein
MASLSLRPTLSAGALRRGSGVQDPQTASPSAATKVRLLMTRSSTRREENLRRQLPTEFVMDSLRTKALAADLSFELKMHIPFIILFVFMFYASRHVDEEYFSSSFMHELLAQRAVPPANPATGSSQSTYKWTFFSMGQEMPDVYNVLDSIVVPTLFNATDRQTIVASGRRTLRDQLVLIGALRLRAKHVRPGTCSGPKQAYGFGVSPDLCYAQEINEETENRDVLQYRGPLGQADGSPHQYSRNGCEQRFSTFYGTVQSYSCGGFILDVPFNASYETAQNMTKVLRTDRFCYAVSLRFFELRFFAYHMSTKSYVSVQLLVETTSTGGWYQQAVMSPFISARNQPHWIGLLVAVMLFVLFFLFRFFWGWRHDFVRTSSLLHYPLSLWNFLDIVNYLVFLVFFVFYVMWWKASRDFAVSHPDLAEFNDQYPADLADIQYLFLITLKINAFNFLLIFLKILKFLRLNERVNILTRTLERAAQTIFTIVAVFSVVVLAYALAANVIYGGNMFEFRNISNSWSALFRLLIGDFDYEDMRNADQELTFVFFWSFVILGLFIFLNMIVAVIMDCFEEERKSTESFSSAFTRWVESLLGWMGNRGVALRSARARDIVSAIMSAIAALLVDTIQGMPRPESTALWAMEKWCSKEQAQLEIANRTWSSAQAEKELKYSLIDVTVLIRAVEEYRKSAALSSVMSSSSSSSTYVSTFNFSSEQSTAMQPRARGNNVVTLSELYKTFDESKHLLSLGDLWVDMAAEYLRTSYNEDAARLDATQRRVSRATAQAVADAISKSFAREKVFGADGNNSGGFGQQPKMISVLHFLDDMAEHLGVLADRVEALSSESVSQQP